MIDVISSYKKDENILVGYSIHLVAIRYKTGRYAYLVEYLFLLKFLQLRHRLLQKEACLIRGV